MELLGSIISSALIETSKFLCGYCPSIKNFIRFKSNLSVLEKEMNSLLDLRNKVREDVDSSDAQMTLWLREVEQIMLEVNSVQEGTSANNEKLCGCFFNCRKRSRFSRETARMLRDVERLRKAGDIAAKMVGRNCLAKAVEYIPAPSIEKQTTASENLAKVMDLLKENDVRRIGVWGMGGVGKTTLVKNLNNKLKESSSTLAFGIVIWATVSKKLDLKTVQLQLAERLNMEAKMGESVERLANRLHHKLLKEKFLLILDDVWESIDLDCLGIPQPEVPTGSKIIVTCRKRQVCTGMKTQKDVKVDTLDDEEAWQLFVENAGKEARSEQIESVARAVARECSGLPLAIITVGKAMSANTTIEQWKDALSELQSQRSSIPDVEDLEEKLYKPLKLSYDSLQGKNIKSCFLYCCLYPEDYSIEVSELVNCWLGEGLIDEQKNYEDSYNRGIALIEKLKDSCLLEHGAHKGTVKMHDVVRDVAVWISQSLEDGCKSLVQSGIGSIQISEAEMLQSLKRVSLMHNEITKLPDCGICCPETMSLLLQYNCCLDEIPDGFLQAFQSLRVLNLCETSIQCLPQSISKLEELRVLLLGGCIHLKELSQLGRLTKLQVLDCHGTIISELPSEMRNLRNLRQLDLSYTHKLRTIQGGIISGFSNLEVLDMTASAYNSRVMQETEDEHATFKELLCLEHLLVLSIQLRDIPTLDSRGRAWIGRLRRFHFVIGQHEESYLHTKHDGKRVTILGPDLLRVLTNPLLTNATSLVLCFCKLDLMPNMLATIPADWFAGLKSLTIEESRYDFPSDYTSKFDLLPNLEELHVVDVKLLKSISQLIHNLGLSLSRLRKIRVKSCSDLRFLLSYGNPKLNTEMLEVIKVEFCGRLCELFRHTPEETEAAVSVVPNLRKIQVRNCEVLTKLPLRDLNPNTIEEIRGHERWWHELEQGSDADTKVRLQNFFKPENVVYRLPSIYLDDSDRLHLAQSVENS